MRTRSPWKLARGSRATDGSQFRSFEGRIDSHQAATAANSTTNTTRALRRGRSQASVLRDAIAKTPAKLPASGRETGPSIQIAAHPHAISARRGGPTRMRRSSFTRGFYRLRVST